MHQYETVNGLDFPENDEKLRNFYFKGPIKISITGKNNEFPKKYFYTVSIISKLNCLRMPAYPNAHAKVENRFFDDKF